jgi:hypothetical protein
MSNYAETAINKYVWKQFEISKPNIYSLYGNTTPIFPVSDNVSGNAKWSEKPYIIYDSFAKGRTTNKYFYPIKSSQMMYSIKGKIEEIFEWRDFIINVLDREDAAAFDINEFAGQNIAGFNLRLHCINVSQVNYIGNSSESSGTKKAFSTNLIIKYDYHSSNIYNNS